MTTELTKTDALAAARRLAGAASEAIDGAVASAARLTNGGKLIDEHQVHAERIAQLATEARAANELVAYAERRAQAGKRDALAEEQAFVFAAEVVH
ncbi:MAG: acyl-CoA dehydrogenase family protein, partial [Dehalococcoidia bacterium]|nr:acyl-CoA dehydrogenase family protein [Dehalococcoidia bacterium]